MGQAMLEGCQMNCQQMVSQKRSRVKSQLYINGLIAQLPQYNEKQNYMFRSTNSLSNNNRFLQQIKHVPTQYIEFVNYLFVSKIKFQDKLFPNDNDAIIWGSSCEAEWARLSDMNQHVATIYKAIGRTPKSKTLRLLEQLDNHFTQSFVQFRPVYVQKVGFAICRLNINGQMSDVVVDDFIPTQLLKYYTSTNFWYFLLEKAIAKVLGNYSFIEEFTFPELFQQITGLPYELHSRSHAINERDSITSFGGTLEQHSFKDVIESEDQLYLQGGGEDEKQVYIVQFLKNFEVKTVPLQRIKLNLFKIKLQKKGKLSIRVSFLNSKFYSIQNRKQQLKCNNFQLYSFKQNNYILQQSKILSLNNQLYLKATYLKLNKGDYILLVGGIPVNRANLILYAQESVSVKSIQSKQAIIQITGRINIPGNLL